MKFTNWLFIAALGISTNLLAEDVVNTLYDRTDKDVRVGIFENQLQCNPGTATGFETPTRLVINAHWLAVVPHFTDLNISGELVYRDVVMGDRCAELRKILGNHDFVLGTGRRIVTEHFGIRFSGVCWHWMREELTFETKGLVFKQSQYFTIGSAPKEKCQ